MIKMMNSIRFLQQSSILQYTLLTTNLPPEDLWLKDEISF